MSDLPIHAVLPQLLAALRDTGSAVLVAPPGAGKTTAVAPALLDQDWCTGQILITSPRRVAARAAAERMAQMLGEKPGETVGYLTRLDSKQSARTRIIVMTEAIAVNRLVADPELEGVSAILFDEAHERHLDADLGLALALETREVLRDDLRIVPMSATIDGARFASLMGGGAAVIESEGTAYPLEMRWLGSSPDLRIEDAMAKAIRTAWGEQDGGILAFLPGVAEIARTQERLEARLPDALILPLHGQVDPAAQRAAISRDAGGRRRIVLATAIAETSLTLDGVSVVVDSGLSRRAEYDQAAGATRLVTRRASQATATQRAGRAARQGPGVAYRLWEEGGHGGREPYDPPEILTRDLAPPMLALAMRGTSDPLSLQWLDNPPNASLDAARGRLQAMDAVDQTGAITHWGRAIAALPVDPAGAAAILHGAKTGQAEDVAKLVLLAQERGLGGRGEDVLARLQRWDNDRGKRAQASRKLAQRWAAQARKLVAAGDNGAQVASGGDPALALVQASPDMLARRRDPSGEHWLSAGGRGYILDPASPLARSEWLIITDAQGQAKGARITAAATVAPEAIETHLADAIERRSLLRWNAGEGRVEARLEKRLGAITLATGPDPSPDGAAVVDMLVDKAVEKLGELLPPELLSRARFAQVGGLSAENLADQAELWLAPLLAGRRDLRVPAGRLAEAALGLLDWDARQRLDQDAPREFISPAGTHHTIAYTGDDAPSVELRVQALFGLDRHPMVGPQADGTPLLLKLTSPAGRPIQSTRDLPGFWRGSWADVCKDMKGRYPKHRWPDQPWMEKPSLKTKNAFSKSGG